MKQFHSEKHIFVGFTVNNVVLQRLVSGADKRNFRTQKRRYTTSKNENLHDGYPDSNVLISIKARLSVLTV